MFLDSCPDAVQFHRLLVKLSLMESPQFTRGRFKRYFIQFGSLLKFRRQRRKTKLSQSWHAGNVVELSRVEGPTEEASRLAGG
jgi:hypothetical protein